MTSTIETRLERWSEFLDSSTPGYLFHVNYPDPELEARLPPAPPLWPEFSSDRIARRWAEYELMCQKAKVVDDDRVPYLSNMTGTEIFAEAFGCQVFRPTDNNPFALPLIQSAAQADRLRKPDVRTSSLAYLFDIADELYRRGGPGAIMKPVDIQSPMDIVALIWEKKDLYLSMIETPEAVINLAEKVRQLLVEFFDEWFMRYGTTFVAHYPDYVMHGGITMSVDEVGAVNTDMFRRFFRDELVELSEHFGGLGIHCCADARHQWGKFSSLPGLRLINHNAPTARNAEEYILDSLRFYGGDIAQMPSGWKPVGSVETWLGQIPEGLRLVFEVDAQDLDEARRIADRVQELR